MTRLLLWSSLALLLLTAPAGVRADRPGHDDSGRRNALVNDPCLDPPPTDPFPLNTLRTVQSETEIAVLNSVREDDDDDDEDDRGDDDRRWDDDHRGDGDHHGDGDHYGTDDRHRDDDDHGYGQHRHHGDGHDGDAGRRWSGKLMVAGYNDSYGDYDNRQGISGFSYSTDGGKQWIDGGGLPPVGESDAYLGRPVVAVHHRTKAFYYASIYRNPAGGVTISVNRGQFKVAPQQVPIESFANRRCEGNPALYGIPDPPAFVRKRIIWEPPVEAVPPGGADGMVGTDDDDALDKEWLYVNQETGVLYLTYTRFGPEGTAPIELVRSFDGGQTWTPPSVIVPNLDDTFNHAAQPVVTPSGRVVVTWLARTFDFSWAEVEQRIETAVSDDCRTNAPCTFSTPIVVASVNPQGTPLGDNRAEFMIENNPSIMVDKGRDDGVITWAERRRPGFGNVYITYFDGRTPLPQEVPWDCIDTQDPCNPFARAANVLLSRSLDDGTTYRRPVKVNDDRGDTSHVFPSVQVNKFSEVFVTWIDRRVDRQRNLLNDTWGDVSTTRGASFGADGRISTVSADWITRWDRIPNFGDYNSSEVVRFTHFFSMWADGRFPRPSTMTSPTPPFSRPPEESATPDSYSAIIKRHGSTRR